MLTILEAGELLIDIKNTFFEGFDCKGHLDSTFKAKWGEKELVADIYHSRANERYERGKYKETLKYYEGAIALNPLYEKALRNEAIVLDKMGTEGNCSTATRNTKR